jgi:LytS/YehU family sensor histidine kinase
MCALKIIRAEAEKEKQEAQLATLRHEREAVNAQLKSLRLQMNPHFLFNSLNAIQQMILAGEDRNATRYLSKFSRLLRLVLLHSDKDNITLKEELETLHLYVELESLRFNESFHYEMICDEGIDPEEIKVPVMLIQPFVENAIWHGLLHKQGDRYLKIEFSEGPGENISCVIEDNGIGREAAQKISNGSHTKKGIAVAEERLKTHNVHHNTQSRICIDDIKDERGNAAGTRVLLVLN